MGIGTGGLIAGGIGAIGSITGSAIQANASGNAADEQAQSADKALGFNQQVFNTNQANIAPYLSQGSTSAAQLLAAIQNGTFGPGSTPAFQAPTAAQVQQTPGYEFELQQGNQGVLNNAAALGLSGSGGTAKALAQYDTGLASTTYNNSYNQALQAYQANLANQSQQFQQLLAPVQLGESAAVGAGSLNNASANTAANLTTQIGNAQAAGTVGVANAINSGISGATGSLNNGILFNQLFGGANPPPLNPSSSLNPNVGANLANGEFNNIGNPGVYAVPGGGS